MKKLRKKTDRTSQSKLGRRTADESGPGPEDLARIALDLFAKRHFASVTIKDIGRAANVNSAMIYYYYRDKNHLFHTAIESAIDDAFRLFAQHCDSLRHENAADAIASWFDVHVTLYKQLRNVVKISLDCSGADGTVLKAKNSIERFYRHENEILQKIVREGIRAGIFKRTDPAAVAVFISTSLDGILARSLILKDFDMLATVEHFKQALWLYLGYDPQKRKVVRAPARERGSRALVEP